MKKNEKYIRFSELTAIRGAPIQEARREVTPPGFEPVVKALKRKGGVENPWAVAWSMKDKGYSVKAALAEIEGGKFKASKYFGGGKMKVVRATLSAREASKIKLQSVSERAHRLRMAAQRVVREAGWNPARSLKGLVKQTLLLRQRYRTPAGRAFHEAYNRREPIPSWREVAGRK